MQPRSPTSSLLRGPPTPSFPSANSSGLPLPLAYLGANACSLPCGRQPVRPQTDCASEIRVRLPALPVHSKEKRGPPRFLGRPLLACQGRTPRRMQLPLAYFSCGKTAVAFRYFSTLGIRNDHRFRGRCPLARTLAHLRIADRVAAPVARFATGWGGYPFAGRVSHPLDDIPNFMNSSHDSLPSDQPFLVALKGLCSPSPDLAGPQSGTEFRGSAAVVSQVSFEVPWRN